MKTTILLVRHGLSEGNVADVFTGHSGYPLAPLGHKQAIRTAEYLKQNYPISAVYSSDLPRAFQTAEKIAKLFSLPIVTDCRFREIFAGEWEDKPFGKLIDLYPADFSLWLSDLGNARCTNGEAVREVAERMVNKISEVAQMHEGECIVIASHATPIRSTLWWLSGASQEAMLQIPWGNNCAISALEYEDGVLSIVRVNYSEHLANLQTSLPKNV